MTCLGFSSKVCGRAGARSGVPEPICAKMCARSRACSCSWELRVLLEALDPTCARGGLEFCFFFSPRFGGETGLTHACFSLQV